MLLIDAVVLECVPEYPWYFAVFGLGQGLTYLSHGEVGSQSCSCSSNSKRRGYGISILQSTNTSVTYRVDRYTSIQLRMGWLGWNLRQGHELWVQHPPKSTPRVEYLHPVFQCNLNRKSSSVTTVKRANEAVNSHCATIALISTLSRISADIFTGSKSIAAMMDVKTCCMGCYEGFAPFYTPEFQLKRNYQNTSVLRATIGMDIGKVSRRTIVPIAPVHTRSVHWITQINSKS